MTPIPLLASFDPSLACTGALLVTLDGARQPVGCDYFETVSEATRRKKRWGKDRPEGLEKHHDEYLRAVTLCTAASRFLATPRTVGGTAAYIAAVAIETPVGAKDANAAWSLCRAGVALRCALAMTLPDLSAKSITEREAKRVTTGKERPEHPKQAVANGVRRFFTASNIEGVMKHVPESHRREAIYDAGGVALVALRMASVRLIIEDYRATWSAGRTA